LGTATNPEKGKKMKIDKYKYNDRNVTTLTISGELMFPKLVIGETSFQNKKGKTIKKPKPFDSDFILSDEDKTEFKKYIDDLVASHQKEIKDTEDEEDAAKYLGEYRQPYAKFEDDYNGVMTNSYKIKVKSQFQPKLFNNGEEYTRENEFKTGTPATIVIEPVPYSAQMGTGISFRINKVYVEFSNPNEREEEPKPKQTPKPNPKPSEDGDDDDIPF
jgi:hypothetical protein